MKFLDGPLMGLMSYIWLFGTIHFGMHDNFISIGLLTIAVIVLYLYIKASCVFYRLWYCVSTKKKLDPELMGWFTYMMSEEVRYK